MKKLTLRIKDIQILTQIKKKLYNRTRLSPEQRSILTSFLNHLPPTETLLLERFPIDDTFEIKVFDMEEMWPLLEKWIDLFNKLPKNGDTHYPCAGWIDADESEDIWHSNIIIDVTFIPSFAYSKRGTKENKIIGLNLKTDGTATFQFWEVEDAENFPELYNFKGSWKEAYFLTVKTLQHGWPQTQFPKEFEQFL